MATKRARDGDQGGSPKKLATSNGSGAAGGAGGEAGMSKDAFRGRFAALRDEFLSTCASRYEMPAEAVQWIREMMDYSVPGGKLNRGLTVPHCLGSILGRSLTAEEESRAVVLGWCVELLQACFLVADDVMDDSVTRRGAPCWYRLPHVKMNAVNDSFILKSSIYVLLKRHFGSETELYARLVDLFREVTLQTELGQLLDLTSQHHDKPVDLDRFTIERYRGIVKYKTAFYSFYMPVALAMMLSGESNEAAFDEAREILVEMGEYFQIQDDFLDAFGSPEVIGKIGTDIQDNKCSWLVVQALSRATDEQRAKLKANYGVNEPAKIEAVKALYRELQLPKAFKDYEDASYAAQKERIAAAKYVPAAAFEGLLAKIYKRSA